MHADVGVTLEDDRVAAPRFHVNAIAQADDGTLVDPYHGVAGIERRVLRVSPAFAEDPVRILRAARFLGAVRAAGVHHRAGNPRADARHGRRREVDALVPERVWQNKRALEEPAPSAFLGLLRDCGALVRLFPGIDALFGVPQRIDATQVDAGLHTQMVCDMAARLAPGNARIGFAAMVHDLGKALTPTDQLPKHIDHEHHAGLRSGGGGARYRPHRLP